MVPSLPSADARKVGGVEDAGGGGGGVLAVRRTAVALALASASLGALTEPCTQVGHTVASFTFVLSTPLALRLPRGPPSRASTTRGPPRRASTTSTSTSSTSTAATSSAGAASSAASSATAAAAAAAAAACSFRSGLGRVRFDYLGGGSLLNLLAKVRRRDISHRLASR